MGLVRAIAVVRLIVARHWLTVIAGRWTYDQRPRERARRVDRVRDRLQPCRVRRGGRWRGGWGGGGGGGRGGAGGGAPQAGLTYSGNSSAAVINGGNAAQLSTDLLGGGAAATVGPLAGVATAGPKPTPSVSESLGALAHRLQRASRIGMAPSGGSQALAGVVPVDQTQPCDSGGTARVFGTLNDN